ncbi:MAG: DNA topoisomerase (ATP-hydrolyzing) [Clostridia bacterium]
MVKTEKVGKQTDGTNLILKDMEQVMHDSMMPYAEHVIMDRALPRVEDGLKPVQRRILYAMYEMGVTPDKPYLKSARIVGDCMGKYHPHGDSSIYQAMVRMAQGFSLCMPLIDGQGNFGSIDGDSAAAMRYTEAKLTPLALELLADIDKGAVPFCRNYDDSRKEPEMLPGRYPNLLVNGASGIAVGLATNIPPHNFAEVIDGVVAYIDNRKLTLKELLKIIKGPDFPTGAYIITDDLMNLYETGKGKFILRGKVTIEKDKNDKKNIVVTQLPYQVNKSEWLKQVLDVREKYKEQLSCISEIVDESDKDGMRAVVRLKKDADVDIVLQLLYKSTNLEIGFSMNMVAIADAKPMQMGLLDVIKYYTQYQEKVVTNRTAYDLNEAKERDHILSGLVIAVKNIDEVIAIIKSANGAADAKAKLKVRFNLSDAQAQAILDLRLVRLNKLEVDKLIEEQKQLRELMARLTAILKDKQLLTDVIKTELLTIKKNHRVARRSVIVSNADEIKIISDDDTPLVENYIIAQTADGYIKKIPQKNYNLSNREINANSSISEYFINTVNSTTIDTLIGFTSNGNAFKVDVQTIAECKYRDKGTFIKDMFPEMSENEQVVAMYSFDEVLQTDCIFITKSGMIKRSNFSECILSKTQFYTVMKLKYEDNVIAVDLCKENASIMLVTQLGMCLNIDINDIPTQGRIAGGVAGMLIADIDSVIFGGIITEEGEIALVTDKGHAKRVLCCDFEISQRRRKGVKIIEFGVNGTALSYANYVTKPYNIALCDNSTTITQVFSTEELSIQSRQHKGKPLMKGNEIKVYTIFN